MSISIVLPTLHGMGCNAAHRRERWNPKRCGELSEAVFLLKATEQGFLVAKPWGDSDRYDFIVDFGNPLLLANDGHLSCSWICRRKVGHPPALKF